ncbi:COF family HAD hydrolase protein [Mycoplasmopsis maculosa]|uniref:COF family HAD hydrolase protein n=1 Tax=Mycoplasmopsis maculosa TaxID=114885 RepID=A0A449B3L2_9BACT|nr:HAD hydrolase family protein [Mycoplasmopsis maculosa]VEU75180.1 COF family HAD hydrolase protein [Mycoplasmopsis maculosa]
MSITNNKIFTYFLDLDGTLFDLKTGTRISKNNINAIMMIKKFVNVVISTGRSYNDHRIKETMKLLQIEDAICSGGGEIYINNNLHKYFKIEDQLIFDVLDYAYNLRLPLVVFDKNGESVYLRTKIDRFLNKLFLSKKWNIIELFKNFDYTKHNDVIKLALIVKNPFKAKKIIRKFSNYFGNKLNAYIANKGFVIEITSNSSNKGIAEQIYLEAKGLMKENAVHIGDSDADACVKGYVGKLVAMKNGSKLIKTLADEVAPNYKYSGIYKYFLGKVID